VFSSQGQILSGLDLSSPSRVGGTRENLRAIKK